MEARLQQSEHRLGALREAPAATARSDGHVIAAPGQVENRAELENILAKLLDGLTA